METTIPGATTAPAAAPVASTPRPSFRVLVSFWRARMPEEGPIVKGVLYFRTHGDREDELVQPPIDVCKGQTIRTEFQAEEGSTSVDLPVERDGRFFLSAIGTRDGQYFAEVEPRYKPAKPGVPDALRLDPPGAEREEPEEPEEPERFDPMTGPFEEAD